MERWMEAMRRCKAQGNCTWISLDRPNAPGWLVPKRALRNCASFRPCWARRAGHSSHLRHRRGALTAKNFKCDCPGGGGEIADEAGKLGVVGALSHLLQ